MTKGHVLASVVIVTLTSQLAAAALSIPAFRGSPNSSFGGWESFTIAFGGPNLPDDPASTAANASISQSSTEAVIISSGNLYSGATMPAIFLLTDSVAQPLQEVVLQMRTAGLELDPASLQLRFTDMAGMEMILSPAISKELSRVALGGPGGFLVEHLFSFDLTGLSEPVLSYSIDFATADPHVSLDRVELDTRVVPAPTTWCALGAGFSAMIRRRRAPGTSV